MIQKVPILLSFFGLWISSYLSENQQFYIGFLLILTFGILHGANDFQIIEKITPKKKLISKLYYVLLIGFFAVIFYFIPTLALVCFILVSGYHFGEQHYIELKVTANDFSFLTKITLGLLILNLLFFINSASVINIVHSITSIRIEEKTIIILLIGNLIVFVITIVRLLFKKLISNENLFKQLIALVVLTIIFKTSSLIWGFAIYFIVWHSLPSLYEQIEFLYSRFSLKNFISYVQSALLYWILAIGSLLLYYYYFNDYDFFEVIFFSFLSAITFPHSIVIEKMFHKKTESKN